MSYKSIASIYAVIYENKDSEWICSCEDWAEVHMYHEESEGVFRLVSWIKDYEKIIFNLEISSKSVFLMKSEDFFTFRNGPNLYGLGVASNESQNLDIFVSTLQNMILRLCSKPTSSVSVPSALNTGSSHYIEKLGTLKINTPKPSKNNSMGNTSDISGPTSVKHTSHVSFNALTGTFDGLPEEWARLLLNEPFGTSLNEVETIFVAEYNHRIPRVLIQMKEYLKSNGAFQTEGIFRLAPDSTESQNVKTQIEEGTFKHCDDINCVANSLKLWFRSLPCPLLSELRVEDLKKCVSVETTIKVVSSLSQPQQAVFTWLLDLCAEVAEHSNNNKMGSQNLATVIAPNLFNLENSDPMSALVMSQNAVQFMNFAILWRTNVPNNS